MARLEEDLELQKKIMREKRELAMQRRREEEAREEAARKERIKAKLEAMGPPPERKSAKKETSPEESNRPAQAQSQSQQQDGSAGPDAGPQPSVTSPGSSSTAPVTAPHASDKPFSDKPTTAGGDHGRRHGGQEAKQPSSWVAPSPQQERLPTWGASAPQAPRNVWGSPNNDRGLGNGTFSTDLVRLAESQVAQLPGQLPSAQGKKGPAPIAPPSSASLALYLEARVKPTT
ncbi:hypothetical protein Ct61P_03466 [Colletotrichum tofieldiae]|nr:hypothetical protein Ct61P_03466 [Colletotrichum tofieldiae]